MEPAIGDRSMPKKLWPALFIYLLSLLLATASAAQEIKPGLIVQGTVSQVLELLDNETISKADRKERIYKIVGEQINFPGMSRRILAINWKKATDEQKQRFESLFRLELLNTYWERINNYNDEKVEYVTGMIEGNRFATVDTVIISDEIQIPITYRMELVDEKWMAYDFLIESLSLVTRYRTEYRNIIKTHGLDGLLMKMENKLKGDESTD